MRKFISLAMAAAVVFTFVACNAGGAPNTGSGVESESASTQNAASSPDAETAGIFSAFSTTDLEGNAVDASVLSDYKITMINVWATFCPPCLKEMPDLGELHKEYADKGVQVIGLVIDVVDGKGQIVPNQVTLAQQIAKDTNADYLHLLPSEDLEKAVLREVSVVPTTFFVDAQGKLLTQGYEGARSKDEWAKIIDDLLLAS